MFNSFNPLEQLDPERGSNVVLIDVAGFERGKQRFKCDLGLQSSLYLLLRMQIDLMLITMRFN